MNYLSKLKTHTLSFLKWARLVGEDDHLDWTTVSLVTVLAVIAFKVTNPGVGELAALFLTLLARAHKKHISSKLVAKLAEHKAVVTAAQEELRSINSEQDEKLAKLSSRLDKSDAHNARLTAFLNDLDTRMGFSDFGVRIPKE